MNTSEGAQPPNWDVEGSEDLEEDPGEELEAMIEQADRPFASDSFGTTAAEQEQGESLDQKLGRSAARAEAGVSTLLQIGAQPVAGAREGVGGAASVS